MEIAVWIIAICIFINAVCNVLGTIFMFLERPLRHTMYDDLSKSLDVNMGSYEELGKKPTIPPKTTETITFDGTRLWTPEECDYLLAMYVQEEDMDVVAKNLGRSVNAVKKKLKKLLQNS